MYDDNNVMSPEIIFNFATRLATNLFSYDKIIIDYDKIEPNKSIDGDDVINVQVIVVMPEVDADYNIVGASAAKLKLETRYNNQILSNTDLIEHNGLINEDITLIANTKDGTVVYDYSNTKIRNKPVKDELITALSSAVKASGMDFVTITSGLQPGITGIRIGSSRHDSGLAADLHVTYKGRILDSSKTIDQIQLTQFVKEAVKAGIKAGGISKNYMGNNTMHLDMLGKHDGKGGYNGEIVAWRSDSWFINALTGSNP
jgi:hypothetical protein